MRIIQLECCSTQKKNNDHYHDKDIKASSFSKTQGKYVNMFKEE